ncbi:hypothetical protein COO60DRAFT_1503205 [Scenedesmus sp. NREL 46B-D3]|nr:hypothetical protein COO60DRAFT_1503205 [Scenedesmus sp. NREL 46B-D3]
MDPWSELGVSKGAGQDEIKQSYRKLVLQHHPDRHASSSLVEQEAAAARLRTCKSSVPRQQQQRRVSGSGLSRPGVNPDWSYSPHTPGGGYTSTMSRWEWYQRLGRASMRSFSQTLHMGLAVLLLGGGLLFEYSHSALWQARNKGKSFEEMQSAIKAQQQSSNSSSNPTGSSSDPNSSSRTEAAGGVAVSNNSSSSSSEPGKVWHVRSAWADGMRGRMVS